jgi:putative selenate reductase
MVTATIPDYRAASRAVNRDFDHLRSLGVQFRYDQEIGRNLSLEDLREEGFSSIVIAIGARHGLRLDLEGEESEGVLDGLDFLRAARAGEAPTIGVKVGVIGGGDVAMDCSRTARRLTDGEVTVYYRRTRAEMPAQKEELLDLFDEGGSLEELVAPRRLMTTGGRLSGVEMSVMRLGDADDSGRRRPEPIPGAHTVVELDTLIVAIGQRPDLTVFEGVPVELTPSGYLAVDPDTLETSIPGVYAGGDIIGDGPTNIVKACGDGRIIADAIIGKHRKKAKKTPPVAEWPQFELADLLRRRALVEPRVTTPHLPANQRKDFAEVVLTLPQIAAEREAARCLDCDLICSTCDSVCPNRAILTYRVQPCEIQIPQFLLEGQGVVRLPEAPFRVNQGPQVAVLSDACNECGNCVTFCPTSAKPWRDKPRLYLDRTEFEAQEDNAFMLMRLNGARGLQARFGGSLHQLFENNGVIRYATPDLELALDPEDFAVLETKILSDRMHGDLVQPNHLGSMVVLHRSFAESMPEYPLVEMRKSWSVREKPFKR